MSDSTESPETTKAVAGQILATVQLKSIVAHPKNPRGAVEADQEMVDSIKKSGLLQPPTVLPIARVAAAWPEHAEELLASGAEHVLLMGYRRWAAATKLAGKKGGTVTVNLRTDAMADSRHDQHAAMTTENVGRKALTPMQEARAFQYHQREEKLTERQIAARCGASQSNVNKRLQLLLLPESAQEMVEAGELSISHGLALAAIKDADERQRVWSLYIDAQTERDADKAKRIEAGTYREYASLDDEEDNFGPTTLASAIAIVADEIADEIAQAEEELKQKQRDERRELALKRAADEGVEVIDPIRKWGYVGLSEHRLSEEDSLAIEEARDAGKLVAAIDAEGALTYYTTVKPKPVKAERSGEAEEEADAASTEAAPQDEAAARLAAVREREERERLNEQHYRAAVKERDAGCTLLARQPHGWADTPANHLMIDTIVSGCTDPAAKLAYRWLAGTEFDVLPQSIATSSWRYEQPSLPWAVKAQAAHAMVVAVAELGLRHQHSSSWTARNVAFFRDLVAVAPREATPWEQARISKYEAAAAARAAGPYFLRQAGDVWHLHAGSLDTEPMFSTNAASEKDPNTAQWWANRMMHDANGLPVMQWWQLTNGPRTYQAVLDYSGLMELEKQFGDEVDDDDDLVVPTGPFLLAHSDEHGWEIHAEGTLDGEVLIGRVDLTVADLDAVQQWAAEEMTEYGLAITGWTEYSDEQGNGWIAVTDSE